MLYVARLDQPDQHRGAVFHLHESVFAPDPEAVELRRRGSLLPNVFRYGYVEHLRRLWRLDRTPFLELIALATGGRDLTIVDDWGDADEAPRRILAATLKQIASTEKANAVRRRRERERLVANRSDLDSRPAAPL